MRSNFHRDLSVPSQTDSISVVTTKDGVAHAWSKRPLVPARGLPRFSSVTGTARGFLDLDGEQIAAKDVLVADYMRNGGVRGRRTPASLPYGYGYGDESGNGSFRSDGDGGDVWSRPLERWTVMHRGPSGRKVTNHETLVAVVVDVLNRSPRRLLSPLLGAREVAFGTGTPSDVHPRVQHERVRADGTVEVVWRGTKRAWLEWEKRQGIRRGQSLGSKGAVIEEAIGGELDEAGDATSEDISLHRIYYRSGEAPGPRRDSDRETIEAELREHLELSTLDEARAILRSRDPRRALVDLAIATVATTANHSVVADVLGVGRSTVTRAIRRSKDDASSRSKGRTQMLDQHDTKTLVLIQPDPPSAMERLDFVIDELISVAGELRSNGLPENQKSSAITNATKRVAAFRGV